MLAATWSFRRTKLPEEGFQMRRVMLSFLFAECTSTQLWAQEVKPSWPIPSELKWEAINGYPMAYRDPGEGTPIVLVHGSTATRQRAPKRINANEAEQPLTRGGSLHQGLRLGATKGFVSALSRVFLS